MLSDWSYGHSCTLALISGLLDIHIYIFNMRTKAFVSISMSKAWNIDLQNPKFLTYLSFIWNLIEKLTCTINKWEKSVQFYSTHLLDDLQGVVRIQTWYLSSIRCSKNSNIKPVTKSILPSCLKKLGNRILSLKSRTRWCGRLLRYSLAAFEMLI